MLDAQGGRCAICGRGGRVRHLSVDHDHMIEKIWGEMLVRGLLCSRCNSAIGKFEWADEVLERAVQYMQRILLARQQCKDYIDSPQTATGLS